MTQNIVGLCNQCGHDITRGDICANCELKYINTVFARMREAYRQGNETILPILNALNEVLKE